MVAELDCLHHDPVRFGGLFGDLAGLVGIGDERLFAQHMLVRVERSPGPPAMQAGRQQDVDSIQVWIVNQRLKGAVRPGECRVCRQIPERC